ncbi:MAG: hypothetical protein M1814_000254 [Vezdaea aestivalis]|nr:MAG: hypothetical protein M1814_000254 [Vezdaea aestivalis]
MSQFPNQQPYNPSGNLQFYPSTYSSGPPVSGHTTPSQASSYPQNYGSNYTSGGNYGTQAGFGGGPAFGAAGVSGRMGEQGGLRSGWLAAFGTEGYDGEPPLLEELGVNFNHIRQKTLVVLNPLARIDQHIMDDADLAGPILFFLLFGTFLLFSGRVHFGYIYGVALFGTTLLYWILGLMAPPNDPAAAAQQAGSYSSPHEHHDSSQQPHFSGTLTLSRTASILGYCLLPLVLMSALGVAVPMDSVGGYIVTSCAIMWCTVSSSGMFVAVGRMRGMRGLVAYPVGLFYVGFGIMGIFSSRGTGKLAGKVGGL